MSKTSTSLALAAAAALAGCHRAPKQPVFPAPERPVASIMSSRFSDEPLRDRAGEARRIFEIADVGPGMTVADIGAGEGYLSVRLAPLVGAHGKVLAQGPLFSPQVVSAVVPLSAGKGTFFSRYGDWLVYLCLAALLLLLPSWGRRPAAAPQGGAAGELE